MAFSVDLHSVLCYRYIAFYIMVDVSLVFIHDIVQLSLSLSLCDQEIEKLWKMVDAAHEKESRARDTINQLKLEIANLTKLVEQGAGLSFGQDARCG